MCLFEEVSEAQFANVIRKTGLEDGCYILPNPIRYDSRHEVCFPKLVAMLESQEIEPSMKLDVIKELRKKQIETEEFLIHF